MRITLVSNIFPPAVGGPATHIYHLAMTLHDRGHRVRAVVCTDDPEGAVRPPFPLVRVSWAVPVPLRYALVLWHTWRAARRSDVVYINGIELPSSLGARLAGRPRVLKVVGDWAWESALRRGLTDLGVEDFQHARHGLRVRALRWMERLYCRLANLIVVPSAYVGELVRGWGVPPERIRIIHNALPQEPRTDLTRAAARAELGLHGPIVCNVSRLYAWKRVDELIRMVSGFDAGATLLIVGDGPERPRLERVASETGVCNRVRFVGAVPHERVAAYLRAADVAVLNTDYEGLSHTLVEARWVGVPIVTTDIGGNREILTHDRNALLVPPGDPDAFTAAVNRVLGDRELAARLVAAAKQGVEHFRWDRLIDETLEMLSSVVAASGRPASAQA